MAINNLNPRRTVWFSPHEPSNKYDIWLSKNAHLDENGELTTDSNAQRDCDYIFKIYDCGKWNPIVGFNTTAANKINIVAGTSYRYTFDGELYTSNSKSEFDLPLFTNDSPLELFSAGPLGVALNKFVTDEQWGTIYDNHLKTIILNYPFDLWPAESNTLGGIMMNTFPAANLNHFSEVKYYNNTNKHPFVDVSDIITIINNGDAGDINVNVIGGDGEISQELLYASFNHSRSIKKDFTSEVTSANKPKFSIWGASDPTNAGKFLMLREDYDEWEQSSHGGQDYGDDNNAVRWVDLSDWMNNNYELRVASLSALGGIKADTHAGLLQGKYVAECKLYNPIHLVNPNSYRKEALCVDIRDVKKALDDWYADNDSTVWDLNVGSGYGINTIKLLLYNQNTGVITNRYTHILDGYTSNTGQGLFCRTKYYENGNAFGNPYGLEWVNAQTIVEEGLGISSGIGYLYYNGSSFVLDSGTEGGGSGTTYYPLSSNNYNTAGNYVIGVSSGGTGGSNYYLNGLGQWTTPPNTTYNDFSGSTHGLVPASTAASQDKYLKGDGTWGTPSVEADFDIDMNTSIEDDADFTLNDTLLTSTNLSNPINLRLSEWNYYNIDGDSKTTQFTFTNTHVSGNAIYIRFNTGPHNDVTINTDADIIFSNMAVRQSYSSAKFTSNSSYLITILFGIIKIELITTYSNSENV